MLLFNEVLKLHFLKSERDECIQQFSLTWIHPPQWCISLCWDSRAMKIIFSSDLKKKQIIEMSKSKQHAQAAGLSFDPIINTYQ